MLLLTILSSVVVLAGARPVPQAAPSINLTDSGSLNTTTTISFQDALSLMSLASASATALTPGSPLAGSTSLTSVAPTATVSSSANSSALVSSIPSSANGTDTATAVLSTDLASPTLLPDGSSGNDTDTATAVFSSDSALPTATTSDNSTDTTTLPTLTNSTTISYIIPTAIPQACMAKIVSNISSSSIVTASLPDSTDVSSVDTGSLSSAFSSIDSGSLTATVSASALNASVTDSSALSSSAAVADASVTAASSPVSDSAAAASATVPAAASSGSSLSASAAAPSATDSTSTVVPLTLVRRIAQDDLPDVAQGWQDLCLASGGDIFTDEPCVKLAGVNGINALLADADPCAQQDNADAMIDFAKSTGVTNSDALIANAVAYRQHPRNALNINGVIPSTPYCQRAPRNAELTGLVNAQLPGVNPGIYGGPNFGLVAFGDPSSCPFGTSANVDSCGCA